MPSEPGVPAVTDAAVHMPKTVGVHLISAYIGRKHGWPVSAEVYAINLNRKNDCSRVLSTEQAMGLGNFGISNPKLLSRCLLTMDTQHGLRRRGNSLPTTASTSTRLRSE